MVSGPLWHWGYNILQNSKEKAACFMSLEMVKQFLHKVKLDWTACLHVCIQELRVDAASAKAEAGASADGCSRWLFLKGLRCLGSCSVISQLRLSWHGENKLNSLLSLLCLHQTFKRAALRKRRNVKKHCESDPSTIGGTWERAEAPLTGAALNQTKGSSGLKEPSWSPLSDWQRHGNNNIETLLFK